MGPGFEKMGVASWHIRTYPARFPLHLGRFVLIHTRIARAAYTGNLTLSGHSRYATKCSTFGCSLECEGRTPLGAGRPNGGLSLAEVVVALPH